MSCDAAHRAQEELRAVYDDPTSTWAEKVGRLGGLLWLARALYSAADIERERAARVQSQSPAPDRCRT